MSADVHGRPSDSKRKASGGQRSVWLVVLVVMLAFQAAPAPGQDFDFATVPRVTLGLTTEGSEGTVCSRGLLTFSKTTGPGSTTGTLLSGSDVKCQEAGAFPISGGSLTFFSANRSVTGTLGDEILFGHALPGSNALIAVETFGAGSPAPFGIGLTALVERHGATFSQANLTGTWRIVGLTGQKFFDGSAENYIGTITFFANRSATGTLSFLGDDARSEDIAAADILVSANGSITGVITTVFLGDVFTDVTINALLTADKTFVAGVTASDQFEDFKNGMFFMQRDPSPTTFTPGDLAGSWNLVSLQAVPTDSTSGQWFKGGLTFATAGNLSQITASTLVSSNGVTFPPVADSSFSVFPEGTLVGQAAFDDGTLGLVAIAAISTDKKHIVGINAFGQFSPDGPGTVQTLGLFSMVKLGSPPPAAVLQFSTGNYSVQEGLTATITVNRTGATTTPVTVDFLATDPLVDGSPASGTLAFAAGQMTRTFSVPTFRDLNPTDDRVVSLALSNPTNGATLGRSTAVLNVLNADSTFAFSNSSYIVSEKAGKATIVVTRTGGLAFPTSVPFRATPGTAIAGKHFTPMSGNLSFAKNIAIAKFDVPVKDNSDLDGDRTVVLQLLPTVLPGRPAGRAPAEVSPPTTATLVVTDDDTPGVIKLSSGTYSGNEGTSVVVTIVRAPATAGAPLGGNVSVDYFTSNNASAIGGLDYTVTSGTVTFMGAETTKTVSVPLTKDDIAEGPEHFLFNLGVPSGGATLGSPSTVRVNINDIDKGGVVTLSASSYSVNEGAGNISITVKRTGGSAANASVVFTAGNGSATRGVDYEVSTRVVFGLNETTKTVVIPIFQDTDAEGNETFDVTLSNPQGGASLGSPSKATVTIVDDESAIKFAQAAFSAKEGTAGKIGVLRSGALATPAVVTYNISSITAVPGVDFTGPVSGSLSFAPNVSQLFLMIPTVDNKIVDGNRSLTITLSAPTGGAQLANPSTATFTIVNDDQAGVFRLGAASYTVKEGGSVMVDIVRGPAAGNTGPLGANISVSYATSSGNASAGTDFVHTSGTVVFNALQTKFSVPIQTLPDTIVDPGKSFFFTLSAPGGGATLGSPSSASILIQDDDSAGVVFLSQSTYKVNEAAGNISITVMRTGGTANASVHIATVPGTATDGVSGGLRPPPGLPVVGGGSSDYGAISTTLSFGAGETKKTVVIPILQDALPEGDEVFTVVLSNPQGGLKLGSPSSASVTLVDDEVVVQFSGKFKNNQPEVVRTGPLTANISVQYVASSGTALLGTDFILPPGTLVFGPGVSSRTIPIDTINDIIAEGPETFTITLMNATLPAQLGPNFHQVFTLDDNDFGGTLNFGNTSPTAVLGETKALTVTRSGGTGTIMTVGWAAIGGTAVPGTDFVPASGQVTFQVGQSSQTFLVTVAASGSAAGKTAVFGLMPPGLDANPVSSKLGPANQSTLTILGPPD